MIKLQDLSFAYPGTDTLALRGLTFSIPQGQLCAVVGANGSGKTTLCHALAGFIPHFFRGALHGVIEVAGHSIPETPPAELAGEVGLVFQNPFNQITGARFTVLEEVAFGLEQLGIPREQMPARCREALMQTGLEDLADRPPYELSGGQMQRLALASMLAMRPKVLVLDEPTSQLDPAGTEAIFRNLRQLAVSHGITVVIAEHKLEWVAACADRVLHLAGGVIVADGLPQAVLASSEIETHGLRPTHFTRAGRLARQLGLTTTVGPLPVTLPQAIEYLA